MDPLLPIPQPTSKPPPKPNEPITSFDLAAYSGGTAAFIATQLYSKSYPHLAAEVSKNVVGPAIVFGKRELGIKPSTGPLLLLPQPFGFQDPHKYGLGPNYLYDLESRARSYGMGLEHLTPPHSSLLHTLPDTDPRVKYARHQARAAEQLKDLLILTRNSSVEELLDLLELATGPDAGKVFFEPAEIANQLKLLATARAGGREAFTQAKAAHNVTGVERLLPAPARGIGGPPSALDPLAPAGPAGTTAPPAGSGQLPDVLGSLPPGVRVVVVPPSSRDLIRDLERAGRAAAPLNTPPTNNQQREAMTRAPELLRELVTERSDP